MGYTLATTWILLAIAAIIGFIIGWFLAKKLCKCDDSALRAELNTAKIEANEHKAKVQGLVGQVDAHKSEVTKLRGSGSDILKNTQRIDELESAAAGAAAAAAAATLAAKTKHDAELNALKAELTAATTMHAEAEQKIQGFASSSVDGAGAGESANLTSRVTELEAAAAAPTISAEQLAAGAGVLGLAKLGMDDLKVVEGIGPKIDELLVADGITTWHQLSTTPVERIQSILDAGGSGFRIANPSTWARQAGLLASARWAEFKTLTDELTAGRE